MHSSESQLIIDDSCMIQLLIFKLNKPSWPKFRQAKDLVPQNGVNKPKLSIKGGNKIKQKPNLT